MRSEHHAQAKLAKSRSRPEPQTRRLDTTITNAHATLGTDTSIVTGGSKFTKLAKTLAKEIEASHRWAQVPSVKDSPERKSRRTQGEYLIPHHAFLVAYFLSSGQIKTYSNTARGAQITARRHQSPRAHQSARCHRIDKCSR